MAFIQGKVKPKPVVTGEYNIYGYAIFLNGNEVYAAGNSPHESDVSVPKGRGIGMRTLRKFCVKTGREIAIEKNAIYGGIERISD